MAALHQVAAGESNLSRSKKRAAAMPAASTRIQKCGCKTFT
jgi:hypothetical protein